MMGYQKVAGTNIVEIVIEGSLTEATLEQITAQLSADIEIHGKLRLLEEIRSFEGIDLMTLWKDAQFSLKHINDFTHVAVVADAEWMRTIAMAVNALLSAEVKAFERSDIEAARSWLLSATDPALTPALQYTRVPDSPIVEIVVDGKITPTDIETVIREVEADLTQHTQLKVLEEIRDFQGIDPMALWIDLKQISKIQHISHAAIVADAKWVQTLATAIGGLYPFEMKVFERSQIAAARTWLKAAD